MADQAKPRGLGRGLEALLGDSSVQKTESAGPQQGAPTGGSDADIRADRQRGTRDLPIEYLTPNPNQPRKYFKEADLEDLARSIRERGVLQPIIARPLGDRGDRFEIVAGERRWRAAQMARRHTVPVIVKTLTDSEVLEIGIVENVQRSDLNAIEEASGYQTLMQQFNYTQDQLSRLIGKSRSHVANMVRLLALPPEVVAMVQGGRLSAGHARALIGAPNPGKLAEDVVHRGLNVRQTEALARKGDEAASPKKPRARHAAPHEDPPVQKDADTLALERNVSNALGLGVSIEHREDGGEVRIRYTTLEQLDDICRRLAQTQLG